MTVVPPKRIAFLVFPRLTFLDFVGGYDALRRVVEYLKAWGTSRPLASICTGALLLGRAGYLAGQRATTHHDAYDALRPLCREVVTDRRIVDEGQVVTAGGGASSLDLGLYLVEKYWGRHPPDHRRPDGLPRKLLGLAGTAVE